MNQLIEAFEVLFTCYALRFLPPVSPVQRREFPDESPPQSARHQARTPAVGWCVRPLETRPVPARENQWTRPQRSQSLPCCSAAAERGRALLSPAGLEER